MEAVSRDVGGWVITLQFRGFGVRNFLRRPRNFGVSVLSIAWALPWYLYPSLCS